METRRERRIVRKRLRKIGGSLAVVTALGVMGAVGGTAFAGQGSSQCSEGVCETNFGGYGSSYHNLNTYSNGNGESHNFSTYSNGGRSDRP
jgi:hypothetical protein